MEINKEQIDALNAQLKIKLTEADLNPKVEASLIDIKKKAQLKGFRPGHVPMGLVKKMYGKAVIYEEMNKLVSETLTNYLKDTKLEIIGEPIPSENQETIDLDTQKEYNFSFDLGLRPDFEIDLNKKLKIPYYKIAVDDKMIDSRVESYTGRYGKIESTETVSDKSYIKGKIFQIDEKGVELENGLSKEDSSISVAHVKDEETKAFFIGKKRDDKVNFEIRKAFASDSEISMVLGINKDEVRETDQHFGFIIKEITEFVTAEINQELFDKVYPESGITSENEFREKIKIELASTTDKDSMYKFTLDAREKLIDKTDISLPEEFLKRWLKLRDEKDELTDEKLNEDFPKLARDLKWQLMISKLIKDNDLKVEFDEVKDLAVELTEMQFQQYYGLPSGSLPKDQMEKYATDLFLKKEEEVKKLYDKKFEDKVVGVIKEAVKLDEKEVSVEEFNKLFSEN